MADYPNMYRKLFNSITDAVEVLQQAQRQTEEMYVEAPDPDIRVLDFDKPDNAPEDE